MAVLNLSNRKSVFLFLELMILLALPVLNLNLLYLILVLIITSGTKFLTNERFSDYGFFRPAFISLLTAAAIGITYGLADNLFIEPAISKITHQEVDLGDYAKVKGNLPAFLGLLALGWIVGGLFEEFFFRGYLFNRIRHFITNSAAYRITAIGLTSIIFALAHSYQGITGIADTFIFAVIMGLLYFYFRKNIWCLILVHGFFDTVGITMIFLGY